MDIESIFLASTAVASVGALWSAFSTWWTLRKRKREEQSAATWNVVVTNADGEVAHIEAKSHASADQIASTIRESAVGERVSVEKTSPS